MKWDYIGVVTPNKDAPYAEWQKMPWHDEATSKIRDALVRAGYTGMEGTSWPIPATYLIAYASGYSAACAEERRDADAEIERLRERLRRIERSATMSAAIMRDAERTGGWSGSGRVASAFLRIATAAKEAPG